MNDMNSKAKILIVDDKLNTLKVLCAILQDEGYSVLQAKHAEEALAIFSAEEHTIDAVVADLKMPGTDGLGLYRKLRQIDADLPFIIMTAYGSVESAVKAMKEGKLQ